MFLNSKKIVLVFTGIVLFSFACLAQQLNKIDDLSLDQQTADLTLLSAINQLAEVKDLQARVLLAGSIIPMLAKSRPTSCREMLDDIFREALKKKQELNSPITAASTIDSKKVKVADPDVVIMSLIKIAGKFSPALAKKYSEEYTAEKDSKNDSPLRDELKLKIAIEMIESDLPAAISLATQALRSGVTTDVLIFLATLRQKDIALANNFAATALQSIEVRHSNEDVNELLLILAYVFTPQLVPTITPLGLAFSSIPDYIDIADTYPPNPALAQQFIQSSMKILLASSRYAQGNLAERAFSDFYLLGMLDSYSPSVDVASTFRKQKTAISQFLRPEQLEKAATQLGRWNELRLKSDGIKPKGIPMDADYFSKRADQEKDPKLKDQFYYRAASKAVFEKQYDRALELVGNISINYRENAQQFINFHIALQAIRDGKLEQTEKYLAKDNNLSRRAYLLTLMAKSLVSNERKDGSRAIELLSQVTTIATRVNTDKEKAAVLFGAARVYSEFDSGRAFETLGTALQSANNIENFDGNCVIVSVLEISGFYFDYSLYSTDLTFMETITRLSQVNFSETLQYLREIKNPLPRLQAVVLSCQSPFSKKEVENSKN